MRRLNLQDRQGGVVENNLNVRGAWAPELPLITLTRVFGAFNKPQLLPPATKGVRGAVRLHSKQDF